MRFLGHSKSKADSDAAASSASDSPSSHTNEDAGRFGFARRILDANDGRYRAMLESSTPERTTIAQILLGMVIGMMTAYLVIPTEFAGASPRHLSSNAVAQWVRMVAVGHSDAIHYDDANTLLVLQRIPNPQQVVDRLANHPQIPENERQALTALKEIPGFDELTGTAAPVDPGVVSSSAQIILALAVVAIGVPVLTLIWRELIFAKAVAPIANRVQRVPEPDAAPAPSPTETLPEQQWMAEETERSGRTAAEFGAPVLHTLSTYAKGRSYDDSFAIELGPEQGSEFLGECGVSAATMTNAGNELQSVELWVFDMASQEAFAKVFVAPAAISDPAFQAAVANRVTNPAVDIAAAEPGAELLLDTRGMRIRARISDIIYNYGSGEPGSGIENLQIELTAWQKQGGGFNPSAGDYVDMQFAPPSQMPPTSPAPPPPAGGQSADSASFDTTRQTPSKPPRRPEDEEDDPFGGSGNFMPSS